MDSKKQYAIKHWLELTAPKAKEQVELALKDGPFQHGPWGEQLSILKYLFLSSTMPMMALPDSMMVCAAGEETVLLDWSLPMTEVSQEILFCRIRLAFEKATAIVDSPADRKRYRLKEEELTQLRNIVCLYAGIRDFLSKKMKDFDSYDELFRTSSLKDNDLLELIQARPSHFSLSMLPSAQKEALEQARMEEEGQTLEAEQERLKVRDARWQYFQAALERDWKLLRTIKEAPAKIESLKHRKIVQWRLAQAELGEKVVNAYQSKFLRCDTVSKGELAQQKINEYRSFVAP